MVEQQELTIRQNEGPGASGGNLERRVQELWLLLSKHEWGCLAVLPADPEGSTQAVARSLAVVGKNLSGRPVSAVTVKVLNASTIRALTALADHVSNGQKRLWHGNGVIEVETEPSPSEDSEDTGYLSLPSGKLIIGVPSVVGEPASLAVVQAVDAVVLGVEQGRTSLKAIRRSVELIGREKIVGCYFM